MNNPSGIIDVAVIQSLVSGDEVKELVKNYGMVITDECHHVSAFSFEQVLKAANAKYVYGLTATPTRQDGHHPIINMQCGKIRYRVDAKEQAAARPFEHFVIPRFTRFQKPVHQDESKWMLADIYNDIQNSELRNSLIIQDVTIAVEQGRNPIILTERTEHVKCLAAQLKPRIKNVIVLMGGETRKKSQEALQTVADIADETAKTRMSGIDYGDTQIRKGAAEAVKNFVTENGGVYPEECGQLVKRVAGVGGTPLVVAKNNQVLGVIYLKDIVKNGVKERFEDLRKMGIRTVMITGDNPMTAAAIAAEAGVDDFLAEATPEAKLALIRDYQTKGHLVAMMGDGTNDAPALAQADVAVAMNSGTQAAKEAGNMVDLDSSPTKLIDIVRIGKQLLMTRGSLTTFSVANDVAKYFAIIPVLFFGIYPQLTALNFMDLTSATTAILSAIIYNALIIVALILDCYHVSRVEKRPKT